MGKYMNIGKKVFGNGNGNPPRGESRTRRGYTFEEIRDTTGFSQGDEFDDEEDVKRYFTVKTMRHMFSAGEDIPTQSELDDMAYTVIRNRWHMKPSNPPRGKYRPLEMAEWAKKRDYFCVDIPIGSHALRKKAKEIMRSHGVRYDAVSDMYYFLEKGKIDALLSDLNGIGLQIDMIAIQDVGAHFDQVGTLVGDAPTTGQAWPSNPPARRTVKNMGKYMNIGKKVFGNGNGGDIYTRIYNRLLQVIPLEYITSHESGKSEVQGFMDLNYDYLGKVTGGHRIALSHYYKHPSGDMIADPDMELKVYPDMRMAEALTYQDSFGYRMVYPEPGMVDIKAKKELNTFLNQWLKNLIEQGHGFKDSDDSNGHAGHWMAYNPEIKEYVKWMGWTDTKAEMEARLKKYTAPIHIIPKQFKDSED